MQNILKLPPPIIALILAFLTYGISQLVPFAMEIISPLLGAVLLSSGLVLTGLAMVEFNASKTTHLPTETPSQMVRSGPYQWTRNPMYLGLCTCLAGAAFFVGAIPLFLAPVVFFIIIDKVFIPYEEAKLSSLFGYVYQEYTNTVKRWL